MNGGLRISDAIICYGKRKRIGKKYHMQNAGTLTVPLSIKREPCHGKFDKQLTGCMTLLGHIGE